MHSVIRDNDGGLCLTQRVSCRPSGPRPHNPTFRLVLTGRGARAEPGTPPACRLHARVRPHLREVLRAGGLVADLLGLAQGGYRFVDGQKDCRLE